MHKNDPGKSGNFSGGSLPLTPKGGGARILGKRFQDLVLRSINSWLRLRIIVNFTDSAGNVVDTQYADIQQTANGSTITLPPVPLLGGSGSGSTTLQWLRVKDDLGSCLLCHSWDGTTEGATPIYVAKPYKLRITIAGENIENVAWAYTYTQLTGSGGIHYWQRNVTGGASLTQLITPDYLLNDEIMAQPIPSVTLDGHVCTLEDMSVRAWAAS